MRSHRAGYRGGAGQGSSPPHATASPTYPEYPSLNDLWLEERGSLAESLAQVTDQLRKHWWCVVRRRHPYSQGSRSFFQEVFLLLKYPVSPTSFRAEPSGRIVYVGSERDRQVVYTRRRLNGYRVFIVTGTEPLFLCHVHHAGQKYRMYRYSFEFHCEKVTTAKTDLHQHLQEYSMTIHPAFSCDYLDAWWAWKEGAGEYPRKLFRRDMEIYHKLAEEEKAMALVRQQQAKERKQQQRVRVVSPESSPPRTHAPAAPDGQSQQGALESARFQAEVAEATRLSLAEQQQQQQQAQQTQQIHDEEAAEAELRAQMAAVQPPFAEEEMAAGDDFAAFLGGQTLVGDEPDGGGFCTAAAAAPPSLDDLFGAGPAVPARPVSESPPPIGFQCAVPPPLHPSVAQPVQQGLAPGGAMPQQQFAMQAGFPQQQWAAPPQPAAAPAAGGDLLDFGCSAQEATQRAQPHILAAFNTAAPGPAPYGGNMGSASPPPGGMPRQQPYTGAASGSSPRPAKKADPFASLMGS